MNLKKIRSNGIQKLIAVLQGKRKLFITVSIAMRDLLLSMGLKSAHLITCVNSKILSRGRGGSEGACRRGAEAYCVTFISLNSPIP